MRHVCLAIAALLIFVEPLAIRAQKQSSEAPIRVQTTLVSVPVIVSDRDGRYIAGLKIDHFRLYQDSVPQPISAFDSVEEPLNVVLLLDTSLSTSDVLDDIKKDAGNFLRELRPQDRAMVVSFDHDVRVLSGLTADRKALERAVRQARIGERAGTALRDAVARVIDQDFKNVDGRKAIILLTDGKDFGSRVAEDELLENAAESGAMIYPVFFETRFGRKARDGDAWRRGRWGSRRFPMVPPAGQRVARRAEVRNERAKEFLTNLSERSAGRFYDSEVEDLKNTFKLITEELRHQYRLAFYPEPSKADGNPHSLRVEVTRPGAVVRARKSYVAATR